MHLSKFRRVHKIILLVFYFMMATPILIIDYGFKGLFISLLFVSILLVGMTILDYKVG